MPPPILNSFYDVPICLHPTQQFLFGPDSPAVKGKCSQQKHILLLVSFTLVNLKSPSFFLIF